MRARDTSGKAAEIHAKLNRALTPEARFQRAMEMSDLAREFAKAALRRRHPDYTIIFPGRCAFFTGKTGDLPWKIDHLPGKMCILHSEDR